jgi:hypothetical protein
MIRLAICCALLAVTASSGCSICCTPYDDAYPTYGSKWERTDRFCGRVGSAFHPAGPEPVNEELGTREPTPAKMPMGDMEEMPPELPETPDLPETPEPETMIEPE